MLKYSSVSLLNPVLSSELFSTGVGELLRTDAEVIF